MIETQKAMVAVVGFAFLWLSVTAVGKQVFLLGIGTITTVMLCMTPAVTTVKKAAVGGKKSPAGAGTKTAAYYVLKHNTVPAILIELGFISGNSDYSKLTNATFQKNAANSIYKSIQTMFQTYPTGR